MPYSQLIPSFNAGELSPYMLARSDIQKYASGCETLENFVIMPYGGVYRRAGTEYINTAKTKSRVIGFNFSTTTSFILEMGEQYIRFFSNGVQVLSGGIPLEVVTPYLEAHIRDVQYVQINDIMYFVHPLYPVAKLSRITDTNWTFEQDVAFSYPAFLDETGQNKVSVTGTLTAGSAVTVNANGPIFTAGNVGSYYQIAHIRPTAYVERTINGNANSSALDVLGNWSFTTYGTWDATVSIQRSYDNGANWETIRSYDSASDRNVTTTGNEETQASLRIVVSNYTSNTNGRALLEAGDAKIYGVVKVTGYTNTSQVSATIVKPVFSNDATAFWAEGAWSSRRGYPRTVALHEARIFYGGTASRPLSVWGSNVDDFENFRLSTNDDSGLFFTLSSPESNPIQWLVSQDQLLIGTAGDEWTLGGSDQSTTITPTNIRALRQSSYGSKYLRALVVNNVILFVQRQGRKVRELVYSFETDGYNAPDLTVLSEHITQGEILECAFQQQPDAIYWTVTGAGQLVGMTYERDQAVVGWHRHTTDGFFESVATIHGANGEDEVWFVVRRNINGSDVRYIERFKPGTRQAFESADKSNWWYLDCAKRVINSPANASVTGLSHLNGESVDILADEAVSPARTVTAGAITLQSEAANVLVGLPFASLLKPTAFELQTNSGSTLGAKKRIAYAFVYLRNSLGGQFSWGLNKWDNIYPRTTQDLMDQSPPVMTGPYEATVAGNSQRTASLSVRQTQPLPLTILAINNAWDVAGK